MHITKRIIAQYFHFLFQHGLSIGSYANDKTSDYVKFPSHEEFSFQFNFISVKII